ncbi:MAG: DUF86 domain-containing protein [Tannerella sp.]|jgi:uncharacterized protein with HEPN domain|nr:DUF86 domain-containing protein [Tannerella sp.]
MYDRSLIPNLLDNAEKSLNDVLEWTANIVSVNDFMISPSGMILLNAVCMKLFSIGEEIKSIDKRTDKRLFPQYPEVNWKEVMKMRDVIAHHYFEIDAEVVFDTLKNDVPPLLAAVRQIREDLKLNP